MSADPLAVHVPGEADFNLYAYVSGAVLKNIDPLGLEGAPTPAAQAAVQKQVDALMRNTFGTTPARAQAHAADNKVGFFAKLAAAVSAFLGLNETARYAALTKAQACRRAAYELVGAVNSGKITNARAEEILKETAASVPTDARSVVAKERQALASVRSALAEAAQDPNKRRVVLYIHDRAAPPGSEKRAQLNEFVKRWNAEIARGGGQMRLRKPSQTERQRADAENQRIRKENPDLYPDATVAVGHVPDMVAGGRATGGPTMPLDSRVNSSVGAQTATALRQNGEGFAYNAVVVIRDPKVEKK